MPGVRLPAGRSRAGAGHRVAPADGRPGLFPLQPFGFLALQPSVGVLLKFTDDLVTLVLIRGSNFDMLVNGSINLTDRGLQRHRILWVREMDADEVRRAGHEEPTIDRIEVAEFPSNVELQEW